MATVKIYLKGWRDGRLYADAVNNPNHPRHAEAWALRDQGWTEWKPGHLTFLAVEYNVAETDDMAICERAFELFNIGDPDTNAVVHRYRSAGNRSLSVGDVVVIDDRAFTCASFGWEPVEFTPTPDA